MAQTEVIYLYRRDTIHSVRELLAECEPGTQVWLVAPRGWPLLNSLVQLKMLRRAGEAGALDLRLVSGRLHTRALAHEAGLALHTFLPPALWGSRRHSRGVGQDPRSRVLPVSRRPGWPYSRRPKPLGVGAALLSLVVVAGLVGALVGVAASLVPSATITLYPETTAVEVSVPVTAFTTYREVDTEHRIIPARVIQEIVEGRGETAASGRVDEPDAQAAGEVLFTNRTTEAVHVPEGTMLRTGAGPDVRFYTVADVDLDAALFSHVRVPIVAVEPGPQGNVPAFSIRAVEGELANKVNVLNDRPTDGGTMRGVPVVAAADFDTLRALMMERLQQEAYAQIVADLAPGEFVPAPSLDVQVMSQRFDQVAGARSDVLAMDMKVVVRGLVVDGWALEELGEYLLGEQAGPGLAVLPDSLLVETSERMRVEQNAVYLSIDAQGMAAPRIDEEEVKRMVRGRTPEQAVDALSSELTLGRPPEVALSPEWWAYVPWLPGRITVRVVAEQD